MALSDNPQRGFGPVLNNKAFRNIWTAQALAQTAQNAIHFVLIVLIERLTGASMHQGLMILSFTLPAIIFAPITGIIIDRWPKKWILVWSNALRVLMVLAYLVVLSLSPEHSPWWLLTAIYIITFTMSVIGQFFNPAETATIPLLVGKKLLMPANSLFNLTLALAQVIGLIILGPLTVKLIGVNRAFTVIAGMYLLASLLVSRIPRDQPARRPQSARSGWERAWGELKEGWSFVIKRPPVLVSMMHLTLIASLVMILAMLAPGIASRVLHLAPADAIVVFSPAGLGMLVAASLLGRWGHQIQKDRLAKIGLIAMSVGFAGFGWVAWRFQVTHLKLVLDPSVMDLPPAGAFLVLTTVLLSLYLGLSMSGVNIVSQTVLQERTTDRLRGRVFAVQFMLNNLVGIPPMLAIGGLADLIGIPQMLVGISVVILAMLALTLFVEHRYQRRLWRPISSDYKPVHVSANGHKPGINVLTAETDPDASPDESRPAAPATPLVDEDDPAD